MGAPGSEEPTHRLCIAANGGALTSLSRLCRAGRSREAPYAEIKQARGIAEVVCVQNHYNLAHRDDDALIDELAGSGVAYVPFFPLGSFYLHVVPTPRRDEQEGCG
jgi:aryl-alcohol dehydrogenase-like predicted oxidoreductase